MAHERSSCVNHCGHLWRTLKYNIGSSRHTWVYLFVMVLLLAFWCHLKGKSKGNPQFAGGLLQTVTPHKKASQERRPIPKFLHNC